MNNFKQMLREAIKSVFCEMNSLSSEDARSEIRGYINDTRTSSIFYAWDNDTTEYYRPVDAKFDWSKLLPIPSNRIANSANIPSLFIDEQPMNESFIDDKTYKMGIASDDYYFMYKAAA